MLNDYDAKAVAEVMGIAFFQSSKVNPLAKSSTSVFSGEFSILVNNAVVLVVEARSNNTFAQFKQSRGRMSRNYDFKNDLVTSPSPMLIEKAVEKGLPRQALRHVAELLAGDDKAKASWLEWGVVPKTTLERRETQLSPQESERTERVARLFVHARRALGTEAEAREFMTTPHPQLDERSPVDAARTDLGARRTEQILNALEYGLAF